MSRHLRTLLTLLLCALVLPLAACGDDSEPSGSGAERPAATPDAAETVATLADSISKDLGERPQLAIPTGGTPTTLVKKDIVTGSGPAVKKGDRVNVQYVGALWSTGQEFDASWNGGQPFSFTLGEGGVIAGWDAGVPGMRPGGRRLLVIPPDLGYGEQGSPPTIGPNETLAFVVDLPAR
jgi:peptidylprolyl isomerase